LNGRHHARRFDVARTGVVAVPESFDTSPASVIASSDASAGGVIAFNCRFGESQRPGRLAGIALFVRAATHG